MAAAGREGMAERRVAARKRSESAGAAMHGVASAAAAGGGGADAGLFFGDHRDIRIHHLVSDDREACDRSAERGSDAAVRAALRCGSWRDAAERVALRPDGRAAVAHRVSLVSGRGGAGADAAGAGKSATQFCGDDRGRACTTAFMPSFWALPTELLTASAAAASIGFINSVGNLGGFAGPYFIGYLRTATGSFAPGLGFLLACTVLAGGAILLLRKPAKRVG